MRNFKDASLFSTIFLTCFFFAVSTFAHDPRKSDPIEVPLFDCSSLLLPELSLSLDVNFLKLWQGKNGMHLQRDYRDPHFQTRFYYANTAAPTPKGDLPIVDARSPALVIFIHGAGTSKASGRNIRDRQNELAQIGYSVVGFDLPHHVDGPTTPELDNADAFMAWLHGIVETLRYPGQKVYLVGHSFGPAVILEYLARFPGSIEGALLVSPASFDAETRHWYINFTSKMAFRDKIVPNVAGSNWMKHVLSGFVTRKTETAVSREVFEKARAGNSRTQVEVLYGDREEFLPASVEYVDGKPLVAGRITYDMKKNYGEILSRALPVEKIRFTESENIGHKIIAGYDSFGISIVGQRLMRLMGITDEQGEAFKKVYERRRSTYANQTKAIPEEELARAFISDPVFRTWYKDQIKHPDNLVQTVRSPNSARAAAILRKYAQVYEARWNTVARNIVKTKELAPDFYLKHQDRVDAIGEALATRKKVNCDSILNDYLGYLEDLCSKDPVRCESFGAEFN